MDKIMDKEVDVLTLLRPYTRRGYIQPKLITVVVLAIEEITQLRKEVEELKAQLTVEVE